MFRLRAIGEGIHNGTSPTGDGRSRVSDVKEGILTSEILGFFIGKKNLFAFLAEW